MFDFTACISRYVISSYEYINDYVNRGRGRNRTTVSLFESDVCDCIALFDALTTTTAAAVHDLVFLGFLLHWWWEQSPLYALCHLRFCDFSN